MTAERQRDAAVDRAVESIRYAVQGSGLCLPSCVLLQRVLAVALPGEPFVLRLGALHVQPHTEDHEVGPIAFDPRGPDGVDGGFHAWLETSDGRVLDPSIAVTLCHEGYTVDPGTYCLDGGRKFTRDGLLFLYEELADLELINVEESEPQLAHLLHMAFTGEPAPVGTVFLDVRFSRP